MASLAPSLARAAFPYLKTPPRIEVGYGMAVYNPLVHPERSVRAAYHHALRQAAHQRQADELLMRERLLDIILRERIVTAFQPIMDLKTRSVLGYEALSRGARGSGLEPADALFGAAESHELLVELDRLCRQRALLSSSRIPSTAKIFVNTLPGTIRDPGFRGKALIDFLDRAQVSPDRIVIEITEKLVIDNYTLFREAMTYYTDLGMSFAVDDVGAGYSGLESIARLKPTFLKIDIALVRDVHASLVNREMVKAIVAMGRGIGATVIAEGIHAEEEARALLSMGVSWGQGYLLARPEPGPEPA
jgi:EAL domain-containing protein (putative c-di-GMP-specific phosphodiesterase class I)